MNRVNFDNLLIKMGFPGSLGPDKTREYLEIFQNVPYKKICFYYDDYCRVNYIANLDLIRLLSYCQVYSRY